MILGDLIVNHDSKRIPLSARQRENIEKKYPYYGAQGIIDYVDDYLFDGEYLLIAEDGENLRSRKQPIAAIVSGKFWVNNHAHVVSSNQLSNLAFLCLWLNFSDISEYITGSAQPKLNQSNMNLIPLPDFSKEEQDQIAEKLYIFEKKMKNNIIHIDILENMANELYKKIFIQGRDVAGEKYIESTVFDHIIEVNIRNRDEKDYPVLSVVKEGEFKASEDVFTKRVYSKSTKNYKIVCRNQVAYNPARANIGSIAMLKDYDIGLVSPVYTVFQMKDTITPSFFYYYMKQPIFHEMIKHHAIGTTRQNFPFEAFKMFPMSVPPMNTQLKFEEIAKPVEKKIAKLKEENEVLSEIRGILLPKLMGGELLAKVGEK